MHVTPAGYRLLRSTGQTVARSLGIIILTAFCLSPIYWMVVSSLRPHDAIFSNDLLASPADFTRAVFAAQLIQFGQPFFFVAFFRLLRYRDELCGFLTVYCNHHFFAAAGAFHHF